MAFWHPEWTVRTCYAELWLERNPTLKDSLPSEVGMALGQEERQRWLELSGPQAGLEDFAAPEPFLLGHFGFSQASFQMALDAWKEAFEFLRISVDSNVIIGMDRPAQAPIYTLLRQLHHDHALSVGVSARFVQDKWADQDQGRIWRHHQAFRFFDLLPSCARADESLPDYDVPADPDLMDKIEHILRVDPHAKSPNQRRDADHIYSHLISNRDYFLTHEKRLLQWNKHLLSELGIVAMPPEAFLSAFLKAREMLPPGALVDAAVLQSVFHNPNQAPLRRESARQ